MSRHRSYHFTALALAIAIAGGCERRTRPPADTLVVLIDTVIETADPRHTLNSYETKLSRLVAPGLTSVDNEALEPRALLADSWRMVDPLTWDFVLKPGLKFSDGNPVTAADVAWTYMSIIEAESASAYKTGFRQRLKHIEAIDERTTRFHLQKPLATMVSDLDVGILSHRSADKRGSFPGGRAVGAGAYMVTELDQRHVVLVPNPYYAGPAPVMPRVELRVVRDAGARNLMLVGGSADFGQNVVRQDLVDDVVAQGNLEVTSGKSCVLTYLMMNNEDPILKDVRVRQAIALAIDRPAIIAAKFSGRALPAIGLLPPGHWAYEGNVEKWAHDTARARALLDAAGFRDPDGPGPRARFHLTYKTSSDQFRVSVARVIAAQLGRVGIDVEVRAFEFGTFFADIKQGSYQLASMQTAEVSDPDFYYTYFHSSRIPHAKDRNVHNRWRYRNARFDDLVERGRAELDVPKRKALYAEAQQIVAREVPIVPLWHEDNVVVSHRGVRGFTILPNARIPGLALVSKEK